MSTLEDLFVAAHKVSGILYNSTAQNEDKCVAEALSHLAPFFAQGVHSGTVERSDHVAENHGTDVTERVLAIAQMWLDIEKSWPSEPGGQRDISYRSGLKDCAEQLISEFGGES